MEYTNIYCIRYIRTLNRYALESLIVEFIFENDMAG